AELDVRDALHPRLPRAEPAREGQRRLMVVLLASRENRPDERDAPLAPELVPAVGDAVDVGVVGVVGAPRQVRPDEQSGMRGRPGDGRLCGPRPLLRPRNQRRQPPPRILVTDCYLIGAVPKLQAGGRGCAPPGSLAGAEGHAGLDRLPSVQAPAPDVRAELE